MIGVSGRASASELMVWTARATGSSIARTMMSGFLSLAIRHRVDAVAGLAADREVAQGEGAVGVGAAVDVRVNDYDFEILRQGGASYGRLPVIG